MKGSPSALALKLLMSGLAHTLHSIGKLDSNN
jgi:hypothetical protein